MTYPAQQFSRTPPRRLSDEELRQRFFESYPEAAGPGEEDGASGAVRYGSAIVTHARVGPIPPQLDPAIRDRDNAAREARWNAMTAAERAAAEQMRQMVREEIRRA